MHAATSSPLSGGKVMRVRRQEGVESSVEVRVNWRRMEKQKMLLVEHELSDNKLRSSQT